MNLIGWQNISHRINDGNTQKTMTKVAIHLDQTCTHYNDFINLLTAKCTNFYTKWKQMKTFPFDLHLDV